VIYTTTTVLKSLDTHPPGERKAGPTPAAGFSNKQHSKGVSSMSKKAARKWIQEQKKGSTVKEFLALCNDMGFWFQEVIGTEAEEVYNALTRKENDT
jgi:hypothetical protein